MAERESNEWKKYTKWHASLSKEERSQVDNGQYPEATPPLFVDLEKRVTAEDRLLWGVFGEHPSIEEILARPEKEPIDPVKYETLKEQMLEVLASPTDLERRVLRLRFGLADGRSRTLKEIGKEIGRSRTTAGRIERKALNKLRHPYHPQA